MVLSNTTNPKIQRFATTTLKLGLAKCSVTISSVCSHPSGPRHYAPAQQLRQGDRIREPATPTREAYLRIKSKSTTVYHTETKPQSGHEGSGHTQHITTEHSSDTKEQTPRARVSLHIQKPKPQASIKNKKEKFHKLFDLHNTIHKRRLE